MKIPKIFTLIISIITAYSFNLRSAKQSYDSYAFAIQWPNGYCKINNCEIPLDSIETNIMTIHGLWPNLKNGNLLKTCTQGVEIEEEDTELFHNMRKYWPSLKGSATDFWEHEYNKHGYCMVQEKGWDGYEEYFEFVIELYLEVYKDLLKKAFGEERKLYTLTYEEMINAIQKIIPNAVFKMNCRSGFIYEFYFFLEKNFTPSKNSNFVNNCESGKLIFK